LKRNFWLFALGRLVSLIGSGIQQIALPLFILDLTGSGAIMGTFVLVSMLPRIAFAPMAGVFGDRFNRKRIMVNLDLLRGGLILTLAGGASLGFLKLWVLFVGQFLISTMDIFFDPATQAMLPDLVDREQLTRANSIISGINSLSYIVGPALGGILYGLFGITAVFLANGISFVASAVSELFIEYNYRRKASRLTVKTAVKEILEGVRFFREVPGLLFILLFAMISNFLIAPIFSVVFPYFSRQVAGFSSQQYGFLETAWVVGILFGNLILGAFLYKKDMYSLFSTGLIVETLFFAIFSAVAFETLITYFGRGTWTYFLVLAFIFVVLGIFNAMVNTPLITLFQKKTPTEIRSRAFSVMSLLSQLAVPLGSVIFGFALDSIHVQWIIFYAMIANSVVTILFLAGGMKKFFTAESEQAASN